MQVFRALLAAIILTGNGSVQAQVRASRLPRLRRPAPASPVWQLLDALAGPAQAKARLDRINLLYGVAISTETLLAHDVRVAVLGGVLAPLLAQSKPGEEVQLFNPTPDGNGGLPLATEAVFGEPIVLEPVPGTPG